MQNMNVTNLMGFGFGRLPGFDVSQGRKNTLRTCGTPTPRICGTPVPKPSCKSGNVNFLDKLGKFLASSQQLGSCWGHLGGNNSGYQSWSQPVAGAFFGGFGFGGALGNLGGFRPFGGSKFNFMQHKPYPIRPQQGLFSPKPFGFPLNQGAWGCGQGFPRCGNSGVFHAPMPAIWPHPSGNGFLTKPPSNYIGGLPAGTVPGHSKAFNTFGQGFNSGKPGKVVNPIKAYSSYGPPPVLGEPIMTY